MLVAAVLCSRAQTFTEHLEQTSAGQGTVTLTQDPRLTEIVNGADIEMASDEAPKNDFSMHIGKRQRLKGYRIQVYWGGSTRADQTNAQRAGTRVSTIFPELRVYTTFESPNWRCRVGDFVTRKEADDYLDKLKSARLAQGAIIVKSEVYVYQ